MDHPPQNRARRGLAFARFTRTSFCTASFAWTHQYVVWVEHRRGEAEVTENTSRTPLFRAFVVLNYWRFAPQRSRGRVGRNIRHVAPAGRSADFTGRQNIKEIRRVDRAGGDRQGAGRRRFGPHQPA
jgi:hypothetical protein